MYQIKNKWTDAVLFASETADSVRDALLAAIAANADLRNADLRSANLSGANLRNADLRSANLRNADLRSANLSGADLRSADLSGADLRSADLRSANLSGADLSGANLTPIRDDLWAVLSSAPAEVAGLLAAIRNGNVDGSTYIGDCACLVGTIANIRHCDYNSIPTLQPNSSRPAEIFFAGIRKGDTPATSQFSALAAGWVGEWLGAMQAAFGGNK